MRGNAEAKAWEETVVADNVFVWFGERRKGKGRRMERNRFDGPRLLSNAALSVERDSIPALKWQAQCGAVQCSAVQQVGMYHRMHVSKLLSKVWHGMPLVHMRVFVCTQARR